MTRKKGGGVRVRCVQLEVRSLDSIGFTAIVQCRKTPDHEGPHSGVVRWF